MARYVTKEDGGLWSVLDSNQLTEPRVIVDHLENKFIAEAVSSEMNYLQCTIAALNTDVSNLTQALENAKSDPESDHSRLMERVNTLASENMVLKNQRETAQHSIRSLGNENSELRRQLSIQSDLAAGFSKANLALRDQIDTLLSHEEEQEEPLVFGQDDHQFKAWDVGFEAGVVAAKRAAHKVALEESRAYDPRLMKREIFMIQGACHRVAARISKIQITEEQGQ